ncbi:MAG: DUF1566 domain-containing protein [Xanthomonadales bacterium]|nr:DUF1566 domain-containing protein [Xanthomonadales bacterium]
MIDPRRARAAGGTLALLIAAAMPPALAQVPAPPLNDSGQTRFYNASAAVPGGPPADFPGQDAGFGRDPAYPDGVLAKAGGGDAGFDFSKLGADGQPLAIQDQAWARDGAGFDAGSEAAGTRWSCVLDHTTGLIWEVKTRRAPADLQDRAWTYSWFSSTVRPDGTANGNNGGHPGSANLGTCLDRYDPVDNPAGNYCDTAGYVSAVNAAGLCGASDWRMPTLAELIGLVHYGRRWPAIDAHYFPNVPGDWGNPNLPVPNSTWTGTPSAVFQTWAWSVYFEYGVPIDPEKQFRSAVRLVRGAP